jgi:hypothetical protein
MAFPDNLRIMHEYKKNVLDAKSPSFCGAKWFHTSIWLWNGWTSSCHHNPPHVSNLDEIAQDLSALHNTAKKKQERAMMQAGERPLDCQFCWVVEDKNSDELAHRTWYSQIATDEELQTIFDAPADQRVVPKYVELGIDRTCNLACSYCCPDISSSWGRDIKQNGPYQGLITDERNHYVDSGKFLYGVTEQNPYAEAFFKWWDTELSQHAKILRITGGEPMMSQHFWRLLDWLDARPNPNNCMIHLTTNLSYDAETLQRFLDRIKGSQWRWTIAVSGESVGAQGEYIRHGLDWSQWTSNMQTLVDSQLFNRIQILTTMSAVSVDGLVEFVNWIVGLKKATRRSLFEIYVSYVRWPTFQSALVLPWQLREQYSKDLAQCVTDNQAWLVPKEQDLLMSFSRYLTSVPQPHRGARITNEKLKFEDQQVDFDVQELEKDFRRFFTQYDQRRGLDFGATFPNLKEWYESIQI